MNISVRASVPSHLKDSQSGFDMRFWVHADKHLYLGISWRPKPARAVGFGPEYAAEACLARADRASVSGRRSGGPWKMHASRGFGN